MRPYTPPAQPDFQISQQFPVFSRELFLQITQAALDVKDFRFAQEAILGWLSAYPGDLQASLIYALALLGNQRDKQAVRVLEGLCQVDPEFSQAVAALLLVTRADPDSPKNPANQPLSSSQIDQWAIALSDGQSKEPGASALEWGQTLFKVRQEIIQGAYAAAQDDLLPVLGQDLSSPLPAVTHLHLMARSGEAPAQAVQSLAEYYLRRWPDCLVFKLYIAESLLDGGETARGVALLHEAARRDIAGQVATRLWGPDHRYRDLWPSHLELEFRWIVPAAVAAKIGWNKLPAGELIFVSPEPQPDDVIDAAPVAAAAVLADSSPAGIAGSAAVGAALLVDAETPLAPKGLDNEVLPIQQQLFLVADRLHRPEIKGLDTRYPVYVIFTVQQALEAKYGQAAAGQILAEASSLAIKIQAHATRHADFRWGARLFVADRLDSNELKPAKPTDPQALKLAIARLDQSLAAHGERIGALLILGGPEIVPFHRLPNPVDDQDEEVASDNPYACRGANYFLPEWPVGRLADGSGSDPSLLIAQVQRLGKTYLDTTRPQRGFRTLLRRLSKAVKSIGRSTSGSFGYTAAVWKPASASVFKPIGKAGNLHTSPPFGLNSAPEGKQPGKGVPLPSGTFAYFNLHGLADAGEWFGQRDYQSSENYPDYPVALRPQDVRGLAGIDGSRGRASLPRVVFSEACYGAHIDGKAVADALSLAFLEAGSEAVVGSTAMSYGSITAPLIGADYLAYHFWTGLQAGIPVGEALRQARLRLAQEMNTRQGYLDGEDQKTLLSFVLFGDPLLQIVPNAAGRKGITRWQQPTIEINTICDRACQFSTEAALPEGTLDRVQQIVAKYLPGMQGASMTVTQERLACLGNGHNCPNRQLCGKTPGSESPARRLVTLSKTFRRLDRSQTHIARLTIDQEGKIVKLVVSR